MMRREMGIVKRTGRTGNWQGKHMTKPRWPFGPGVSHLPSRLSRLSRPSRLVETHSPGHFVLDLDDLGLRRCAGDHERIALATLELHVGQAGQHVLLALGPELESPGKRIDLVPAG